MTDFVRGAPRIVCAANKNSSGDIVIGVRHFCNIMRENIINKKSVEKYNIQGFIDQFGCFYTREEAWEIALKNNQIIFLCDGQKLEPGGKLYSENLY